MHETLREFAEFVGRCLAKRWLREQESKNMNRIRHNADDRPAAAGQIEINDYGQDSTDGAAHSTSQDDRGDRQ